MSVIGIIPARFASSRFPAKMLAPIQGKTLLQRTYESAKKATCLDTLVIATDDQRIFEHAQSFGALSVMTKIECLNGTERLVDAINKSPELAKGTIFVNIQGDRPCLPVSSIEKLVFALQQNRDDVMATPIAKITDEAEIQNPASVKCVIDSLGYALYFSRAPIPYSKTKRACYKHVGIYAYRKDFLLKYVTLADTPLQLQEDLEQLKVLEHGYRIKTVEIQEDDLSVDYPEDIYKVEKWLCSQNISS
jgi:3-deoxy-manno-octulosonate cytidylyltransferase (CMP-KDO synthetase)